MKQNIGRNIKNQWVNVWMEVKATLGIAHSNQNVMKLNIRRKNYI